MNVVKLLLSKGANINDITNDGDTAISLSGSDRIKYILRKWPISMAILILKELSLYCAGIDNDFLIDLYQYIGREDCAADNEEDYNMDDEGDDDADDEDEAPWAWAKPLTLSNHICQHPDRPLPVSCIVASRITT